MDHRVTPCHDEDFSGYVETREVAKVVTGEHKIPWPPKNVNRHISTFAYINPFTWLGCFALAIFLWGTFFVGVVQVIRWIRWLF